MTYVVANRVPVTPEFAERFEESFRNREGKVENHPGFVRMEVLKPEDPEGVYVVLTHWRSKDDFVAWMRSDDFRKGHAHPLPPEACRGKSEIETHELLISASAA
jgi:heme-degrading monooxygenase HmoA